MVSESRVTWATYVPNLVFLGLSVLDLGPMYATDRQTDVRQHNRLMPPPISGGDKIKKERKKEERKVKVHALDIATLRIESPPPQKRSGMAHVLKGSHRSLISLTCTLTRSLAIRMSHTCLCLPSYSWYSFTDPGGVEG